MHCATAASFGDIHLSRSPPGGESCVRVGEIAILPDAEMVRVNGVPVHFTPTEFALLRCLAYWCGAVVGRPVLLDAIGGVQGGRSAAYLDFYLHKVRRKLRGACAGKEYISYISDTGYILFDWHGEIEIGEPCDRAQRCA